MWSCVSCVHTPSWFQDEKSLLSKRIPTTQLTKMLNLRGVTVQDPRLDAPRSDRGGLGVVGMDEYLSARGDMIAALSSSRVSSQPSMLLTVWLTSLSNGKSNPLSKC